MPNCKFCGKPVSAAPVFHIECMEEKMRGSLEAVMDKAVTNADRIRAISDEELAGILVNMDGGNFCENRAECADDLCAGNDIPDERCKECALRWLRKPANERCAF